MKLRKRVGLNLKELRRIQGISQEDLAHRAGINCGCMGRLENAKCAVLLDKIDAAAEALRVDLAELLKPRS